MINTFEANFIAFVDSGSTNADFDDMNLFLENNCSKCVDLIGEFKFNFSLEKNYLFKLKYVECIIEKSGWYTTKLNELYERKMDKYFKRLHSK